MTNKMMKIWITILMTLMMVGIVTAVSPLEIDIKEFDYHTLNTNLSINPYVYNETGLLVNSTCNYKLNDIVVTNEINASVFIIGEYTLDVWCNTSSQGGHTSNSFEVVPETRFGLWTTPDNWIVPILILVLALVFILLSLAYDGAIIGVLGSVMLILWYLAYGAASPILLTPVIIIGFLMAFKFATD